jgi:mRNA interferase MazF
MDVVMPRRFDVMLVTLDPTIGSEIRKTRPCLVVSPDEMNRHVRTVIIAPMTSTERPYPTRVPIAFQGKSGQVALDQIRAVDKNRLVRQIGHADPPTCEAVSDTLVAMFTYDFQPV